MARDPLALRVHRLTVGPTDRPILRDVSFELGQGETAVLLGGNGAGKSTLLRAVAGLDAPSSGVVEHQGSAITVFDPSTAALLLEDPASQFVGDTARSELEFAAQCRAVEDPAGRARTELDRAHLGHLAERSPRTLSGGEQQALLLAAAGVFEPNLLLLDDPFVFLGERETWAAWERVRSRLTVGDVGAVVLATHDTNLAAEADYVGLLEEGRMAAWGPPEVVLRSQLPSCLDAPWALGVEAIFERAGRPLPAGKLSVGALAARLRESVSC